jgi:hypothetical protein
MKEEHMSTQNIQMAHRTAKPVVAGAFNIFAGVCSLIGVLGLLIAIVAVNASVAEDLPVNVSVILWIIAIPLAIIGILAIIGGIYNMLRKSWGLAMVGSIVTIIPAFCLGIASVVLTASSRDEFTQ